MDDDDSACCHYDRWFIVQSTDPNKAFIKAFAVRDRQSAEMFHWHSEDSAMLATGGYPH